MTRPLPEPLHFEPETASNPSETPDLLGGRRGIVAVVVTPEAHASGWAPRAVVALAEASSGHGRHAGLMDLFLEDPALHDVAGVGMGEGVSDIVLFGASVDRVSHWSEGGARIITAGTPVGDTAEVLAGPRLFEVAREAADGGCMLAYMPSGAEGVDALLGEADDVIILRHQGEEVAALAADPSLVLEPPLPQVEETAAEDVAAAATLSGELAPDAAALHETQAAVEVAVEVDPPDAPQAPDVPVVDDSPPVHEVTVDLDDVVDDAHIDVEPILPPPTGVTPVDGDAPAEVGGLEIEPEWPDFERPLMVQEPGTVDPLVAANPNVIADSGEVDPLALDDVLADGAEVHIVADDLGAGIPVGLDSIESTTVEGLVESGLDSLSPVGREGAVSADHVSGLDGPPGWEAPPEEDNEQGVAPLLEETVDLDASAAGPERLDDPWGLPPELEADESPDAPILDQEVDDVLAAPLPWEKEEVVPMEEEAAVDVADDGAADQDAAAIPVADVTRTRARTRTQGPRPFLLILFLLLIATVALLSWLGLLDVAGLDFLRRDSL